VGLAAFFAALQLSTWSIRLRYPGEECMVEGIFLAEMLHLRQGVPIYSAFSPDRFDSANYGPLYYLLGANLVDPRAPSYFPLRLLSVLATLACAAASGLLGFLLTRRLLALTLAPLLFLACAIVTYYGCSLRPDSLGLFLSFAGLLTAFHLREGRALLLAAPLMLLAFFYKQQFIAAPLAVLLYLLLGKRHRLAFMFATAMALGGLGAMTLFHFVAFPGQAFLEHFFSYNLLPFSWSRLASGLPIYGITFFVPLLLGIEFLRQSPQPFLRCYLGLVVLLALLPLGRQGSDTNYFLESALILSSLLAALVAKAVAERSRRGELLVLMGVTLFVGQLFTPGPPRGEDFQHDRAVQDYLRQNFSAGTAALGYYAGDLARAGLELPVSNLFHYVWLTRQGTFSDQGLLNQIRRHDYGLIVTHDDLRASPSLDEADALWTESLRKTILLYYQPSTRLAMPGPEKFRGDDQLYIWTPRAQPATAPPSPGGRPPG
jgi:hypothetical protein